MWICVCSKDAQKQLARTSLIWKIPSTLILWDKPLSLALTRAVSNITSNFIIGRLNPEVDSPQTEVEVEAGVYAKGTKLGGSANNKEQREGVKRA